MRIGSLFSGAGGLDLAVEHIFGGRTVWQCEIDPAASKVLAARWPDTPNYHDITHFDWDRIEETRSVPSVDILCGGYPCQPFSAAGQRKGTSDERHLWPYFAEAIRRIRPRYVVLENVAGHRSLGFNSVLADLAGIGYDAQWCSVRASDVGAPHRRERLFVVAYPNDGTGHGQWTRPQSRQGSADAADATCDGRHEGRPESARIVGRSDVAVSGAGPVDLLPTPAAVRSGRNQSPSPGAAIRPSLDQITELLPTPEAKNAHAGPDYARMNREGSGGHDLVTAIAYHHLSEVQWGKYEPAIRRWEFLTRPAPSPTEPNTKGNPRLSAPFSEWMLGWPAGWVTAVPGISRNDQLRVIGNGVVPQQAVAALSWLLGVSECVA